VEPDIQHHEHEARRAALEAKASREKYQAEQQATLQALSSPAVLDAVKLLRAAS
jgi:hypothetical protein